MPRRATTLDRVRQINRAGVLNLLRRGSAVPQNEIAQELNLSKATISRVVRSLKEKGYVRQQGKTGLVELNLSAIGILCVDITPITIAGALCDLKGNFVHRAEVRWSDYGSRYDNLQPLYQLIDQLVQLADSEGRRLIGVGIGVAGVVDSKAGIVAAADVLAWRDLRLRALLASRVHFPIFINNRVKLMTLGEFDFALASAVDHFVCLNLAASIEAGVIINRVLHHGSGYRSGNVGFMLPAPHMLNQRYETTGALELTASGKSVMDRAWAWLAENSRLPAGYVTLDYIFDEARAEEKWAVDLLTDVVDHIAQMVVNIDQLIKPDLFVLNCPAQRYDDVIAQLQR
jgi:glucokinase